jgi:hypothetical protein
MTTVVNPNGTPAPVYNRSGITIETVAGAAQASPTLVNVEAGTTVILVTSAGGSWVQIPAGLEIGSVIEVYKATYSDSATTQLSGGETFVQGNTGNWAGTVIARKTSSSHWHIISSF